MSSKKEDLQALYRAVGETIKIYHDEKKKIEDRWDLPEEQKHQGLSELKAQAEYSLKQLREGSGLIIDSVRDEINKEFDKDVDRLFDPVNQKNINFVIEGLQRNAFSREDFSRIVSRFKDDRCALDLFKDAIPSDNYGMKAAIPRDKRVDTLERINKLEASINPYMSDGSLREDPGILLTKFGMITRTCLDDYDDNLMLK